MRKLSDLLFKRRVFEDDFDKFSRPTVVLSQSEGLDLENIADRQLIVNDSDELMIRKGNEIRKVADKGTKGDKGDKGDTGSTGASGVAGALDDLSDVDTTGVADGQTIVYDAGSGNWVPHTLSVVVSLISGWITGGSIDLVTPTYPEITNTITAL